MRTHPKTSRLTQYFRQCAVGKFIQHETEENDRDTIPWRNLLRNKKGKNGIHRKMCCACWKERTRFIGERKKYLLPVEFHPRPSDVSKTCTDKAINKMAEHQR